MSGIVPVSGGIVPHAVTAASIAYDVLPYSIIAGANVVKAASGNTAISKPGDAAYSVQVDHDGGAADDVILDLGAAFDMRPYVTSDGYCVVLAEIQRAAASITSTDRAAIFAGLWDGSQSTAPLAGLERNMSKGSARGYVFGQTRNTGTGALGTNNSTSTGSQEPTAAALDLAFGDASRDQRALSQQIGILSTDTQDPVLDPLNAARTLSPYLNRRLSSGLVAMQRATVSARSPAGDPRLIVRLFADGGTARTWLMRLCVVPAAIWRAQPYGS